MIVLYRDEDGLVVMEQRDNTTPSYLDRSSRERLPNHPLIRFCLDCETYRHQDQHGRCEVCDSQAMAD